MTNRHLPIDHFSYSSFIQLLRNPMIFKLREILHVYDSKSGVSAVIGSACHKALEFYYGGDVLKKPSADPIVARAEAHEIGLKYISGKPDAEIDYGKTGSREDILIGFNQAMNFYWAEEPQFHKILICEQKLSSEAKTEDGDLLPLPLSGRPDLVVENAAGEVEIIDHKFVKSFTDYETEDYIKIIQSQFMYHLVKWHLNRTPARMIFREVKRTANAKDKAGQPQIRDWVVPFNHRPYFVMFYNLFKDAVKYLSNDPVFLPNLSDMYDGEQAGLMYAQGLINADMSDVEVMHKVKDVALVSKKFVASSLDAAQNKYLAPDEKIKMRLAEFGVPVEPVETITGPQIIQYRFKVSAGVRMATIHKHKADIERTLATKSEIRILTPVPGTEYMGIEVEAAERQTITLDKKHLIPGGMQIPMGVDVNGNAEYIDLREMPHLLVAGATGSGKSVFLNTTITALAAQKEPGTLQMTLIDPKRVELARFKSLAQVTGFITEPEEATKVLLGLKDEMERRYKLLQTAGKRDLAEYNESRRSEDKKLPYLVTVVDEFADLMLKSKAEDSDKKSKGYRNHTKPWLIETLIGKYQKTYEGRSFAPKRRELEAYNQKQLIEMIEEMDAEDVLMGAEADVEYLVARIAQLGRAAGIHLIIATQRPSVDVITGLIKANFPTRVAFRTSSPTDSIVILGEPGAEKLTGKGDMLLMGPMIKGGKVRLQGIKS
jgi:hypothetical protein